MSSLKRLKTTPTTIATSPARSTLTGSAAKKGHANVGIASVRSCSYSGLELRIAIAYAPMPKKPMCPTDSSPVKPTTRLRLTASMAQIAKTVPTVMANPTPCHSMNPMAQVMTNRFAHNWMLPLEVCQKARGSVNPPRRAKSLNSCLFINNCFSL